MPFCNCHADIVDLARKFLNILLTMTARTTLLFLALLTPIWGLQAQESLIAYWNMDETVVADKFTANNGSQEGTVGMTALPSGFLGLLTSTQGTEDNIYPEGTVTEENEALRASELFGIGDENYLLISGLNLSGLSDISLSFATRSDGIFIWNQHVHLEYRQDGGIWQTWAESGAIDSGWEIESYVLPTISGNASDVDMRIRVSSWVEAASYLDFDNIQINAVPEPSVWSVLAGLGAAGLLVIRRRRSPSA